MEIGKIERNRLNRRKREKEGSLEEGKGDEKREKLIQRERGKRTGGGRKGANKYFKTKARNERHVWSFAQVKFISSEAISRRFGCF